MQIKHPHSSWPERRGDQVNLRPTRLLRDDLAGFLSPAYRNDREGSDQVRMFDTRSRQNASGSTQPLSFRKKDLEKEHNGAPSHSRPWPVLTVVGETAFRTMDSQILVASGAKTVAF